MTVEELTLTPKRLNRLVASDDQNYTTIAAHAQSIVGFLGTKNYLVKFRKTSGFGLK